MSPSTLILAAASQATNAAADLVQNASDGVDNVAIGIDTIPQLADALKMAIEASRDMGHIESDEYGVALLGLHSTVAAFLDEWAG